MGIEEEEDDVDGLGQLTSIPRREIENLFEENWNCSYKASQRIEEDPVTIDLDQTLDLIKSQILSHYQLLLQALGLCGEINGAADKSKVVLKLLIQLKENLPDDLKPQTISHLDLILRGIPQSIVKRDFSDIKKNDPLLRPKSDIKTICQPSFKFGTQSDPFALSKAYTNLMALFEADLNPELSFHMSPLIDNTIPSDMTYYGKRTDCFLQSEDSLLLLGLKTFGLGNWEAIHARFLPMRTTKQISVRYKNLVSRRAPKNSIKVLVSLLRLYYNAMIVGFCSRALETPQ